VVSTVFLALSEIAILRSDIDFLVRDLVFAGGDNRRRKRITVNMRETRAMARFSRSKNTFWLKPYIRSLHAMKHILQRSFQ
jgi:hypothetical protein